MGVIRYLLDTNALSEPVRPSPSPAFLDRLAREADACAISAISWHEALYGLNRLPPGRRRDAIFAYLHGVVEPAIPVLPYDEAAASWHATERRRLEALGRTPPFADGQIAAVARTRGLVLVTADLADFAHFEGLRVESWR